MKLKLILETKNILHGYSDDSSIGMDVSSNALYYIKDDMYYPINTNRRVFLTLFSPRKSKKTGLVQYGRLAMYNIVDVQGFKMLVDIYNQHTHIKVDADVLLQQYKHLIKK